MRWMRTTIWLIIFAFLLSCGPLPPSMGGAERRIARSSRKSSSKKKRKSRKKRSVKKETRKVRRASTLKKPRRHKARKNRCEELRPLIEKIARRHNLEPELVMGVIKVESSFNPGLSSRVGAQGLMQVMPRTARHMKCSPAIWEPENNIECGCRVLKRYIGRYDGNLVYGLSAYNAGPGNTNRSAKYGTLPFNFSYVQKVLRWRNLFRKNGCM